MRSPPDGHKTWHLKRHHHQLLEQRPKPKASLKPNQQSRPDRIFQPLKSRQLGQSRRLLLTWLIGNLSETQRSNWRLLALITLFKRSLHLRTKNTGTSPRQILRNRQMEN